MSNIILFPTTITMSSREIAELTGKEHFHVMRDIRAILDALGEDESKFGGIYLDSYKREKSCFYLPKDLTLTLVAGYNVEMRHRIITRWLELEGAAAKKPAVSLPDFTDPIAAAHAWIEAMEKAKDATEKLIEVQPKVEAFDHFMETEGRFNLTTAMKVLGVSKPRKAIQWLRENGVLYRDGHRQNQPYAQWVDAGYFEVKCSSRGELSFSQTYVTPPGIEWLRQRFAKAEGTAVCALAFAA